LQLLKLQFHKIIEIFKKLCNLARRWWRTPWWWYENVETWRNVVYTHV